MPTPSRTWLSGSTPPSVVWRKATCAGNARPHSATHALVHEVYLRLLSDQAGEWRNRAHFYAAASLAMRRILVDHARARAAAKRPGAGHKVELDGFLAAPSPRLEQLLILDEAFTSGGNGRAASPRG